MARVAHTHSDKKGNGSTPDPRAFRYVSLQDSSIQVEVMMYRGQRDPTLLPLVIINSIDLVMPPSIAFCDQMWAAGYQVIFFRRPGFGKTPSLPAALLCQREVKKRAPVAAEAALFRLLIDRLELKRVTLLGLGTANSICLRLAQLCPEIRFTIYANPLFHPSIWDVIRPAWLGRMIRQTAMSRSGLKIGVRGLRAVVRRDPLWFYTQFAQKSAGDLAYIDANKDDFLQAGFHFQHMSADVFYSDLKTALIEDTCWDPDVTKEQAAVVLSGVETIRSFSEAITAEAGRLGLPIIFADSGDLFVPYASPDVVLEILQSEPARTALADAPA
ncbi:MAG: alpha/beta fold hydrolase [Pseudomonadota bacterium]